MRILLHKIWIRTRISSTIQEAKMRPKRNTHMHKNKRRQYTPEVRKDAVIILVPLIYWNLLHTYVFDSLLCFFLFFFCSLLSDYCRRRSIYIKSNFFFANSFVCVCGWKQFFYTVHVKWQDHTFTPNGIHGCFCAFCCLKLIKTEDKSSKLISFNILANISFVSI